MRKVAKLSFLIAVLFLFSSGDTYAGFGVPKIGGKNGDGGGVSKADALKQQDQLLRSYTEVSLKITESQILLSQAFGLKDAAKKLEVERNALASGNVMSKDEIKKQRAVSEEAQASIDAKLEEGELISAESKKLYRQSLDPYFEGVLLTKDVVSEAERTLSGAKTVIENANPMEIAKLKKEFDITLFLAPKVSPDLTKMVSTGSRLVTYGNNQNIEVPKNATGTLGDL